jgi:hypothetical protein
MKPRIVGIDRNPWAAAEAASTYRAFQLSSRTITGDVARVRWEAKRAAFLAAFVLNELPDADRARLVERLVGRAETGDPLLVIEPLAGFVAPWWRELQRVVEARGGRSDEWRFHPALPDIVARLDSAAGLNHREITGRSLWISGY